MLFTENSTNNGKLTKMCLAWFSGQLDGIQYFTHAGGGGGLQRRDQRGRRERPGGRPRERGRARGRGGPEL